MKRNISAVAVITVASVLTAATAAPAQGSLGAECAGGVVHVSAGFFNGGYGDEYVGLVVTRDWVGACDGLVLITAEPYPLPELYEYTEFSFTHTPPELDKYFGYRLWLADSGGHLFSPGPAGDLLPYDFAACGPAVAVRGRLTCDGDWYGIEPCPDTCWGEICSFQPLTMDEIEPEVYEPYVNTGIPVDLYGEAFVDGMPGSPCLIVTDLQPTPDGECGPVPTEARSWSAIKEHYR